ncbi:MAG: SpoIID/LytB domain-containing protein [Candidatus Eisenbacteria bacterium]|nr:SpoIID/LytB domain-containing protein [Candidatus Eisenbacteria bacterium]
MRRLALAALIAALAAACAPLPRPQVPPPPPVTGPGEEPQEQPPAGGPAPLRLDREPTIDVGLAWDLDSLAIAPLRPVRLQSVRDREGHHSDPIGEPFVVRMAGTSRAEVVRQGDRQAERLWAAYGPETTWVVDDGGRGMDEPAVSWNGRTWRGALKIMVNPRGKLTLAVRLPLETYLLGVVPGEIGGLTPDLLEAGRAQAIAARSYTLFYRGRRAAEGFDIYGTVEDQVYGPLESERPLATKCVEATRGLVALSDGQPIRANYCSTCGGITAGVTEAWPAEPLPYLASGRDRDRGGDWCAASPQFRWHEEWKPGELAANLERFAPRLQVALPPGGVGGIVDVRADARSRSGRVWRLVVTTTTGRIVVPAYALRQVLRRGGDANAILRSNLFKIDVRRDPASGRALAIVATGAGSGHGVGLCQTGALGMARAGRDAKAILAHYYRGAELKRLY